MAGTKLSVDKVTTALRKYRGIMSKTAEACGVSRETIVRFIKNNPELKAVRDEEDEILLDVAESSVIDAIENADMKTTRWFLERKGKERGYVTRQEQTGKNGEPLQVSKIKRVIVDPDKRED